MKRIIIFLITMFIYFFSINYVTNHSFSLFEDTNIYRNLKGYNGLNNVVNIGQDLDVTVIRNRWYGQIVENGDKSYLNGFLDIPIRFKGLNLNWVHIPFMFITLFILFISYRRETWNKQKEVENGV